MYKAMLQELCQKRRWEMPKYKSMKDGPDHIPSFKASVLVNNQTFTSPASYRSSKEAQNEAAIVAFNSLTFTKEADHAAEKLAPMSLSSEISERDESISFKTVLQEFSQKNGSSLPLYETMQSGPSHMPIFISKVKIDGKEFHGKECKTKKLAEQDAAKVAYLALKEGGLKMNVAISSSPDSDLVKSKENLKHEDEPKKTLAANVKVSNEEYNPIFPETEEDLINFSYKEPVSDSSPKSYPFSLVDLPSASVPGPSNSKDKAPETHSYLICNRFKVYSSYPNIAFPEGVIVMPIADNKWVAVSWNSQMSVIFDFTQKHDDFA